MNRKDEQRLDDATRWFMVLKKRSLSPRVLEAWKKWEALPENRRFFDEVARLWSAADSVPQTALPAPMATSQLKYDGSESIERWQARRLNKSSRQYWQFGLAATVLIGVSAAGWLASDRWRQRLPRAHLAVFETAVAEHRDIVLSDGSRIELGAKTTVTTTMGESARTVVLNNGEALFTVARDPSRPFRVIAGGSTITAVGTAFNVRKRADNHVVVVVTEGVVQIAHNDDRTPTVSLKRLERGQQVTYDLGGHYSDERLNDEDVSLAWRSGRLRFRSEPLRNVLPEVNRYSRRQIVLGDRAAGELPFTGTVFERDVDLWIDGLERVYPELEVSAIDDDNVLIRRRPAELPRK